MRTPETTSSPCASIRKSPLGSGAPVTSSRENATPEPEVGAAVAEHHLLHVDRGAPVVGDVVEPAVRDRARTVPRVEHCENRLLELLARIGGKVVEGGEALRQVAQRGGVELRVEPHAALGLDERDLLLEALARDAADDVAEHLHEAPVGVPGEALVAGPQREAAHRAGVEPDVEDGVHHAGHRVACAAADGHQQRVVGGAQSPARASLEARERVVDGGFHALRGRAAVAQVGDACLSRDREARRHQLRFEQARHLGDVRALAAEQGAQLARALVEVVDPFRGGWRSHALNAGRRGRSPHPWTARELARSRPQPRPDMTRG